MPKFANFDVYRDILRVSKSVKLINSILNIAEVYEIKNHALIIADLEERTIYTLEKSKNPRNYKIALKELSEKN